MNLPLGTVDLVITKKICFVMAIIGMCAVMLPSAVAQTGPQLVDAPVPAYAYGGVKVAMGQDNLPIVLYAPNPWDVHTLHCGDATCQAENITEFLGGGQSASVDLLYAADDGRTVARAWSSDGPQSGSSHVRVCLADQCNDSPAAAPQAVDGDGNLVGIDIYFDSFVGVQSLLYQRCTDSLCTAQEEKTLRVADGVNGSELQGAEIAVGPSGVPTISYNFANTLYIERCTNQACDDRNVLLELPVDPAQFVRPSALFVDDQGVVSLVYRRILPVGGDRSGSHRYLLRCVDPSCDDHTDVFVAIDESEGSAAVIDGSGYPAFAFTDQGVLRLIKCTDVSCAAEPVITQVAFDSADAVDLAIDQDGLPVLAYVTTDGYLNVRRCAQAACDGPRICNGRLVTIDMNDGASGIGTPGDDVILGTPNADFIDAGAGDDLVCAGDGNDEVLGGSGNDVLWGELGRDLIRANEGDDMVDGGGGNDRLLGGIGHDVLYGRDGRDYLGGYGGNDEIYGGLDRDIIFGGYGRDTIDGGDGPDIIHGLIGDDTIMGGYGNDELFGDQGNDILDGEANADLLSGGRGNDTLLGGDGNDNLLGGRADDILDGGADTDVCSGNSHVLGDISSNCESIFSVP